MYRPIEILLGATRYGYSVDMWSAGCILGELVLGKTLLPGKVEMEQLDLIFDLLGTPNPNDDLNDLPLMRTGKVKIDKPKPSRLREKYNKKMSFSCLNLLEKLLELDPSKRLTASRALESRYFKVDPKAPDLPEHLGPLQLGNGDCDVHEFQTKKKRKEVKLIANAARDEAKESGMTEEEAEAVFREVYDEQMLKVQEEGSSALKTKEERDKEEDRWRREEERRQIEAEKGREEQSSRSLGESNVDGNKRIEKERRRNHELEHQEREEKDRKRRKRDEERRERDYKQKDDVNDQSEHRRRSDAERRGERKSLDSRGDRKRSSDSRRENRDEKRRRKDLKKSPEESHRYDNSPTAFDLDRANEHVPLESKDKRDRDHNSKAREHKKSSRRDRDDSRNRNRDNDRDRQDYRGNDSNRHPREDDKRNPDGRLAQPSVDQRNDHGPGSSHGVSSRCPKEISEDYQHYSKEKEVRRPCERSDIRAIALNGNMGKSGVENNIDRALTSGRDNRSSFEKDDRNLPANDRDIWNVDRVRSDRDRDNRIPPRTRTESGRMSPMRDKRVPPDLRNNRGPPLRPDWDGRGGQEPPMDWEASHSTRHWDNRGPPTLQHQRNVRGPPHPSDRGPPLQNEWDYRGPPDRRGDRGPPLSDRDRRVPRGEPPSDRGPAPTVGHDRDLRGPPSDYRGDHGPTPQPERRGNDYGYDRQDDHRRGLPIDDNYVGGGYRGSSRHSVPPIRDERRFSPPRDRRR
jgi:Protein kinase domain